MNSTWTLTNEGQVFTTKGKLLGEVEKVNSWWEASVVINKGLARVAGHRNTWDAYHFKTRKAAVAYIVEHSALKEGSQVTK